MVCPEECPSAGQNESGAPTERHRQTGKLSFQHFQHGTLQVSWKGSLATTSSLSSYFSSEGISCSYRTFDEVLVSEQLLAGKPIIADARASSTANVGHCFIIDGYKRSDVTYTYTYVWHNDDGTLGDYEPDVMIEPLGIQITKYCMNWGWGASYDGAYYATSGNWVVNGSNFYYNKHILYAFSATGE